MNFYILDLISSNNFLYYEGNTKHSSLFAVIVSIMCCVAMVFLGIFFSIDIFAKKNPTIFFFKKFTPDAGVFYLNNSSIFHYFQLENQNEEPIYDPEALMIIGTPIYIDMFLEDFDLASIDHWIYDYCTKEDYNEELINALCISKFYNSTTREVYDKNSAMFSFPSIKHGTGSKELPNEAYSAYVMRCVNISYHNCKTESDIEEYQSKLLRVKLGLIDNDFDISIYKNPVLSYILDVKNHLTGDTITNNNLNFNPVEINTDDGFFFEDHSVKTSFRLDLNEKIVYTKKPNTKVLSGWCFLMQNKVETYSRTYPKIQDTLANLGGAGKAIFIIAGIINYFVEQYVIEIDIQNTWNKLGIHFQRDNNRLRAIFPSIIFDNKSTSEINSSNISKKSVHFKINLSGSENRKLNDNTTNAPTNLNHLGSQPKKRSIIKNYQKDLIDLSPNDFSFCDYIKKYIKKNTMYSRQLDILKRLYINSISEETLVKLNLYYNEYIRKQLSGSNVNTKYIWNNQRSLNYYKYS